MFLIRRRLLRRLRKSRWPTHLISVLLLVNVGRVSLSAETPDRKPIIARRVRSAAGGSATSPVPARLPFLPATIGPGESEKSFATQELLDLPIAPIPAKPGPAATPKTGSDRPEPPPLAEPKEVEPTPAIAEPAADDKMEGPEEKRPRPQPLETGPAAVAPDSIPSEGLTRPPESAPETRIMKKPVYPVPEDLEREIVVERTASPNVKLELSEKLINHFLGSRTTDEGPVRDCVLGADVCGCQQTLAVSRIDLVPAEKGIRFQWQLEGTTNAQTLSVTPQAALRGRTEQRFTVRKQVDFDGQRWSTRSPAAFVEARQINLSANTQIGNVPIFGPIADSYALAAADQMRPTSESIAVEKLTRKLAPRFNALIDEQLQTVNQKLKPFWENWLPAHELAVQQELRSTNDRLEYELTLGSKNVPTNYNPAPRPTTTTPSRSLPVLSAAAPRQRSFPPRNTVQKPVVPRVVQGAAEVVPPATTSVFSNNGRLQIHESFLNVAIRHSRLPGMRIVPQEMEGLIREFWRAELPPVENRDASQSDTAGMAFVLAADDPLHVRLELNQLQVTIRATLVAAGKEFPRQRIDVTYRLEAIADGYRFVPGKVDVASEADNEISPTAMLGNMASVVLRDQIASRLEEITIPTAITIPFPTDNKDQNTKTTRPVRLRISQLQLAEGWLTFAVEPISTP